MLEVRDLDNNLREICISGGVNEYITENYPTLRRHFWTRKVLLASDYVDRYRTATEKEKSDWEAKEHPVPEPTPAIRKAWESFTSTHVFQGDLECYRFRYNEETGYYEAWGDKWGLKDLTETDVMHILEAGALDFSGRTSYKGNMRIRTNLVDFIYAGKATVNSYLFYNCRKLELAVVDHGDVTVGMFRNCESLRTIFLISPYGWADINSETFERCKALENITRCMNVKWQNVDLHWSPLLTSKSIGHVIDGIGKGGGTQKAVTLTVHGDVYNKIIDEADEEWHPMLAMAAEKGITITTK